MIAEVGYLLEDPEIELVLLRKGVQPLNEEKFLQVIDYGIPGPGGSSDFAQWAPMTAEAGHILTGLEPSSIRKLVEAGFDIKSGTMQDPRTALLAASLLAEQAADGVGSGGNTSHLAASAEWVKDVSAKAVRMFTSVADAPSML